MAEQLRNQTDHKSGDTILSDEHASCLVHRYIHEQQRDLHFCVLPNPLIELIMQFYHDFHNNALRQDPLLHLNSTQLFQEMQHFDQNPSVALLMRKMDLCFAACNWNQKHDKEEKRIILNKENLLRLVDKWWFMTAQWPKEFQDRYPELIEKTMRLITANMSYLLPSRPDHDEDDVPMAAWKHLSCIYKIAHDMLVSHPRGQPEKNCLKLLHREMRKSNLLQHLMARICSPNKKERQEVKELISTILSQFNTKKLWKIILQLTSSRCNQYMHTVANTNAEQKHPPSWLGLVEILQLMLSILKKNLRLRKPDLKWCKALLGKVLVPLHQAPHSHLCKFQEPLVECCRLLVETNTGFLPLILTELLRTWPKETRAQEIFVDEARELLSLFTIGSLKRGKLKGILEALIAKLCEAESRVTDADKRLKIQKLRKQLDSDCNNTVNGSNGDVDSSSSR